MIIVVGCEAMTNQCLKCGGEPRQGTTKWGAACWKEYRQARKLKRQAQAEYPDGGEVRLAGPAQTRNLDEAAGIEKQLRAELQMLREENARLKRELAGRPIQGNSQEETGPEITLVEDPRTASLKDEVERLKGELLKRANGRQPTSRPAAKVTGQLSCGENCTSLHEHLR